MKRQPITTRSAGRKAAAAASRAGQKALPIVGVGGWAGGLEAFAQLLRNLPADTGMAFVLGSEYFQRICPSCCMMRPTRANKPIGYLLGSYRIATAPEPNSSRLRSLKWTHFDRPANNVGPWPASLGCTTNSSAALEPPLPVLSGGRAWSVSRGFENVRSAFDNSQ